MIPLLVIRHGATGWNEENRLQGQSDQPLSETGRADVGRWVVPAKFSRYQCFSSPLKRALETALILGLTPETEPALTEMSWGEWEGENWQILQTTLGRDVMAAHEAKGLDFRPDGGESPREVQARLKPWLKKLETPALAICHKGILQALYSMATGWQMKTKPPVRFRHGTACLFNVTGSDLELSDMNIPLVIK